MSSTSMINSPSILSKAFKGSGSDKVQGVPERSNQFVREVQVLSYFCFRIWWSVKVIADIKCGTLSADVDAIIANMNPKAFGSQIYPTRGGARFVTVPTTVWGMQGHPSGVRRSCSNRRLKYGCQFLRRSTNTNQGRGSGNVDRTSGIRCVYWRLVLM